MSAKSKIRVGIVGAGGIAKHHAWGYQKHPQAEIVAVCDSMKDRADAFAKEMSIPEVYSDYKKLMKRDDIDAISICLPNFLHGPVALAALNSGKHVLVEKPLANTVKDGEKMVAASKKNKKYLMVAFHNRFRSDTQVLKKAIEGGALGNIYYAKTAYLRRVGIPAWGKWFCTKSQSGGGPLIDIGVHVLDLTLFLMGFPKPKSVSASAYQEFGPRGLGFWGNPCKIDVEDLGAGFIKFTNGASLFLECSWALNMERDSESFVKLYGTEGGATLEPPMIYSNKNNQLTDTKLHFSPQPSGEPYLLEVSHFVDCILQKKTPISTGEQGLVSLKILDAMYRSAKTGKEVILK